MKQTRFAVLLAACALLVSGCTTLPPAASRANPEAVLAERSAQLQSIVLTLSGRVGFSDGRQAGSGNLQWEQGLMEDRIELSVPLAGARYRLYSSASGATLSDGRQDRRASNAGELLKPIIGFWLALDHLRHWSRASGPVDEVTSAVLSAEDEPQTLLHDGWTIEFRDYRSIANQTVLATRLPFKISARRDKQTLKLSVQSWQVQIPSSPDPA